MGLFPRLWELTQCDGFLGFYSTVPSQKLRDRLEGLRNDISHRVYDYRQIEGYIVGYEDREILFMRYFPESYKKWRELRYYREPVKLFNSYLARRHKNFIPMIENVFGKTENLIRLLKDHETIEGVFNFQNLEITVSVAAIDNIFRMKTIEESEQVQETMNKILFREIPQIISEEQGIDICRGIYGNIVFLPVDLYKVRKNSKTQPTYIRTHPDETAAYAVEFCIIYRNHIVMTEKLYKSLNRVLDDLREMLAVN